MNDAGPLVSIVVPMLNEQSVIAQSVAAIVERFDMSTTELILVDDGSTDATRVMAAELVYPLPHAELIALNSNCGKGAALRAGVARTRGSAVIFMDADLSTSLDDAFHLLAALATDDVAIGSRALEGATVQRSSVVRVAMGRSFNWLMRVVTGLPIDDSQCGCKAFRGDIGREIFALTECDRYAIDPEVLRLAHLRGYTISQHAVMWEAADDSKVRPVRDSLRTGVDLFAVRWATRRSVVERGAVNGSMMTGSSTEAPLLGDVEPRAV
jgi:dolichyl-phosphate beta-glucosyltransferase